MTRKHATTFRIFLGWIALIAAGCAGSALPQASPSGSAPALGKPAACASTASEPRDTPERIILNLTTAPATSQAVTWRTEAQTAKPRAQIVRADGSGAFEAGAHTVGAESLSVVLGDGRRVHHHRVIFEGLEPETRYAYRVGAEQAWSEWNHFETAGTASSPFSFVYFGDPQEEVLSKCARVFRAAFKKAPEADFWHFVGDLVDNGDRDEEWADLFEALGWIPRTTPLILLPGNHEYPDKRFVHGPAYRLFPLWRPHFTLPENGPAGLEETVYRIDYQGTRLVMLNGNEKLEEQAAWLDRILGLDPQPWTVVAIHQPIYSTGKYRDKTLLEKLFVPIFDRHGVDLVLQGHDHTYSRSFKLRGGERVGPDQPGTVYVISVSGPKSYPVNPRHLERMARTGTGRQLFQVIRVSPRRLTYEAFDAAGELFDAMELKKESPRKVDSP